jgi:hypothetical protein
MTGRTVVWVHAVGADGATGDHIGWTTLVEPGYALMDPRPAPRSDGSSGPLRAGPVRVAVMMDGGAWVELFDATAHALDEAPELVPLELADASFAPVEQVPVAVTEDEFAPGVFSEPSRGEIIAGLCSPTPKTGSRDRTQAVVLAYQSGLMG